MKKKQTTNLIRLDEWLEISTEGFAQRQEDRPPAHLAKEIIQNALDATEDIPAGLVAVRIHMASALGDEDEKATPRKAKWCQIQVTDNGSGVEDPKVLRTLFSSGKEDRFTYRGRMGQGLKEVLCLAKEADVFSKGARIHFHHVDGKRVTDVTPSEDAPSVGTRVRMLMPWALTSGPRKTSIIDELTRYLWTFIVPEHRTLTVNGITVPPRPAKQAFDVTLKTELFEEGKWVRRQRPGRLELVPVQKASGGGAGFDESEEPMIYEMGIPVCPIDWTQPYHINVLMRIPMNPRRDAVAAGYMKEVYAHLLPKLLPTLPPEQLRNEWVSVAVEVLPAEMRKEIVTKAFGADAVRSVPTFGRHDFDSDARELGFKPLDTRILPSGLRHAAEEVLQTSRDVEIERRTSVLVAAMETTPPSPEDDRIKGCYAWLCEQLLNMKVDVRIVPEINGPSGAASAAWVTGLGGIGGKLLLSLAARSEWEEPFNEHALGLLTHEVAHEIAAHHGDDFRRAVETIAGRLARVCLDRAEFIRERFAGFIQKGS